ncbi:putative protein OS=Tsukamurella paurometabola (strain ATCC 8368 / DSM / CCUG 35730 /CIP 100753 / JCM 10117 / KCTC 9821 / NBRC 16120 / NCIMB 702349/ NCTC 13040) OX=521096 GN=Tpau_3282 PE=4 SV=1 [Tsukamurella paurometabola]|uniref:Uncharacterized protein n=1 Tax=Tsukamurella paurometabola (strain ATCC 8368 / DSM 20162 / CCUG 35730 / CIP 100753 / JCM 10117 / KCTC 9821 / NBRC 16120 / NCIMB 702349 / NCTC 13040) TaxID=521096 RepID=D5UVT5_TSUPD|nr:hypothetical protein [Tsukamurella paurometabola]ADG79867.1 conserved hypothetical protein [Tsukamurella paurometabola DSM 20162]SUP37472.1 Uncharacterised protein [Tsukamurella paurometabola]
MTKPDRPSEGKKYSARDIERIFGDVLPAQTKDDRLDDGAAPGSGAARPVPGADGDPSERWYRENRPPHHGG